MVSTLRYSIITVTEQYTEKLTIASSEMTVPERKARAFVKDVMVIEAPE